LDRSKISVSCRDIDRYSIDDLDQVVKGVQNRFEDWQDERGRCSFCDTCYSYSGRLLVGLVVVAETMRMDVEG